MLFWNTVEEDLLPLYLNSKKEGKIFLHCLSTHRVTHNHTHIKAQTHMQTHKQVHIHIQGHAHKGIGTHISIYTYISSRTYTHIKSTHTHTQKTLFIWMVLYGAIYIARGLLVLVSDYVKYLRHHLRSTTRYVLSVRLFRSSIIFSISAHKYISSSSGRRKFGGKCCTDERDRRKHKNGIRYPWSTIGGSLVRDRSRWGCSGRRTRRNQKPPSGRIRYWCVGSWGWGQRCR